MTFTDLFERADGHDADADDIERVLAERRAERRDRE